MTKIVPVVVGVLVMGVLLLISPFVYLGFKSAGQRRALQNRSDFPQIALACVSLARSFTNDFTLVPVSDPRIPLTLRSLSPRSIHGATNFVNLEFHGGFDHYGYRLRQSETNSRLWTLSYYTEHGERPLTTITNN